MKGAFCSTCGRPAAASAIPPAVVPGGIPMPADAAAGRKKTSVVVWILCGLAAIIVLGIMGVGAVGYYFVRDPGAAIARIITAANPDAEIINVDNDGRRIVIRDRRTGKQASLSFDDVRNGRIRFTAEDENGKTGSVEIGGGAGKLPSWVPVYPGVKMESHITASGDDGGRAGEGGMYTFTSRDDPAQVMAYYQDQSRELGMKVELATATAEGSRITAADEHDDRALTVVVGSGSGGGASGSVTFKRKR
jgi:hypothetical protein